MRIIKCSSNAIWRYFEKRSLDAGSTDVTSASVPLVPNVHSASARLYASHLYHVTTNLIIVHKWHSGDVFGECASVDIYKS